MPAIHAPATVLVTGGTGYIGAWIVRDLLERGFSVLAALRTKESGETLLGLFPEHKDKLIYAVVPDISKDDAYDEVVRDVEGIVHVASPVFFSLGDPQELIGPAVAGTVGILKSAQKFGPKVKRVVITSSVGAINTGSAGLSEPREFTHADWNDGAVERVKAQGIKAHPGEKYTASKTLAERAAWDFVAQNKVNFDLVTVLPSFTFGPWVHSVPSKDKLGSSLGFFYAYLQPGQSADAISKAGGTSVDVRDVATLHSLALVSEHVAGERIIASNESYSTQQIYDYLNAAGFPNIPKGQPGVFDTSLSKFSHSRTIELFPEFKFRDLATISVDTAKQLQEKGWLA